MNDQRVALVLGVGPGVGAAVARRFAHAGFALGLMARRASSLEPVEAEIVNAGGRAIALTADATDAASIAAACAQVRETLGAPQVLVYNASAFHIGAILDITPELFEQCWKATCFGGFVAAQQVLPGMLDRGQGTIIFTGATASVRGSANFACLAVGKFGLRALAQSLAREVGPRGIHVAHVVIDGAIDTRRVRGILPDRAAHTLLSPAAIAETYWQLHAQDPTAWTLELDVRPAVEKF